VTDTSQLLNDLLIERIFACGYHGFLKGSLIIPVPISDTRRAERGFNQSEILARSLSRRFNCDLELSMIGCRNTTYHRAGQSMEKRQQIYENPFFLKSRKDLSSYQSITIVDDVITTGKTLENVTQIIRDNYLTDLRINAICLFRGKPYYL